MQKKILRPDRLRQGPAQFSWMDQRLGRENFLRHGDSAAWAFNLVLVTVADAHGLSYYSEATLSRLLKLDALQLDQRTVGNWMDVETYQPRKTGQRKSKLDPFKSTIVRLLGQHPYTAAQLLHRLKEAGYDGGYSILKAFVQHVRPSPAPAFLRLHFAPGQAAQGDWGDARFLPVGHTRRRLSFFVMVLCYSRRMSVEFTLAQTQEHFLACHQRAFEYFNGVTSEVIVDNCKTAILSHPVGQPAVPHPRYLDLARHYGFAIKACGPRKAHEKGRLEKAVHLRQTKLPGRPATFQPGGHQRRRPALARRSRQRPRAWRNPPNAAGTLRRRAIRTASPDRQTLRAGGVANRAGQLALPRHLRPQPRLGAARCARVRRR